MVMLQPAQAEIFAAVRDALESRGLRPFLLFESHNRAVGTKLRREGESAPTLIQHLSLRRALGLAAFELRLARQLGPATTEFSKLATELDAELARAALSESLGRIALYASCLDAIAGRSPALMATFNEIGRWARLLPQAARKHGVPSVDIAHAEAADPVAIEGIEYDRVAVYGPAATRVMLEAGVPASRIAEIGAPRFDRLVTRYPDLPTAPPSTRRVVFASQWLTGSMTPEVKRHTVEAAVAVARAAAPAQLVIRRHPIEHDRIIDDVLAGERGLDVRDESSRDLYDSLHGAWVLVTGWSNTAFEGLLSNVPTITVNATGGHAPTAFGSEGLALEARDIQSAAAIAASLLVPDAWLRAVARGRAALGDHLGPLDGHATLRLVELLAEVALPRA